MDAAGASFGRTPEITAAGTYLARTTEPGLAALEKDGNVERVTPDLAVRAPLPVEAFSRIETHVDRAARALRVKDGTTLDGTGSTIFDIDSGVFVFHPALFRADGGYDAWVDVDGNGNFDVDVDGVDLDGDGAIAKEEVLHRLAADIHSVYGDALETSTNFRPNIDFLYCDTNGNKQRDYGKGFTEDTPAYGEPLFVLDDANADGTVAVSEKLVRLKTSKIRLVRNSGTVYTRGGTGKNALVNYMAAPTQQELSDIFHGTGVSGILVGGTPGISRWLGLAPNADLIMAVTDSEVVSSINWGLKQKPDVILTEYAPYTGVSLDGSSEEDAIYDAALDKGSVVVSPAGNLGTAGKHASATFTQDASTFVVQTDNQFAKSRLVMLSIRSHGLAQRTLSLQVTIPNGPTLDVSTDQQKDLGNGLLLYVQSQTTSRGTVEKDVALYSNTTPLTGGAYTFQAKLDAGDPVGVDMYVGDDANAWNGGLSFEKPNPHLTICSPSTGDKTISVAAYVLNADKDYGPDGTAGDLAAYSSQGPRIDGVPKMGIAAPDNPMSLLPPLTGAGTNVYTPFGGTSGAGPHVAASVALLRQMFPDAKASDLRERILSNARHDAQVSSDATRWGSGKLDVASALGVTVGDGDPPKIALVAPKEAPAEDHVTLSVNVTEGKSDALKARWDFDYDGTFDTEWAPLAEQQAPTGAEGSKLFVKVEVMDANGNVAADTGLVTVGPKAVKPASTPANADSSDDGCGCATVGRTTALSHDAAKVGGLALALGAIFVRRKRRKLASHEGSVTSLR